MEIEDICEVVAKLIVNPELNKFSPLKDKKFWKGQSKALLNLIPCVGGVLAQELQNYEDYKLSEFFRKFTTFILELTDVSVEDRMKFSEEVQKQAEDMSGNVILSMVDRLDNINKQKILANLIKARIHDFINIDDYFRLSSMLERIPYVDLKHLPLYKRPYYDENGDSELLYATGSLMLASIDGKNGNKYILSLLGEKLITWGTQNPIEVKRSAGTQTPGLLETISEKELNSIFR